MLGDWAPSPLVEFVLKIESRCNLNCDYCYVYNMGDESWRDQPSSMSLDVVDQLASGATTFRKLSKTLRRDLVIRVLRSLAVDAAGVGGAGGAAGAMDGE